jgi:hypothetical protein
MIVRRPPNAACLPARAGLARQARHQTSSVDGFVARLAVTPTSKGMLQDSAKVLAQTLADVYLVLL